MASSYLSQLVSLGAISCWDGNGQDRIGTKHLTGSGSPVAVARGPFLELDAMYLKSASNQWWSITDAAFRPTTTLTIGAWFNAFATGTDHGIIACGSTGNVGWSMRQNSTTDVTVKIGDGSTNSNSNVQAGTLPLVVDGSRWYFAAYTFDSTANQTRLYINGKLDANSPQTFNFDIGYSSNVLYVGNWDGNTARDFDGLIAGAFVYNGVASAQNIADLYDARLQTVWRPDFTEAPKYVLRSYS